MADAPERIRASSFHYGPELVQQNTFDGDVMAEFSAVEYIRADLVPQWQPIETAPKDGQVIIVWDGEAWEVTAWGKVSHVPIYGFLQVLFRDVNDIDLLNPQPTHWMPLPNPPT